MILQHATDERDARPAPSQALMDWMDRYFDAPRREHSGPEALAWDNQGLQVAASYPHRPSDPS